jgi:hypothetical protein
MIKPSTENSMLLGFIRLTHGTLQPGGKDTGLFNLGVFTIGALDFFH